MNSKRIACMVMGCAVWMLAACSTPAGDNAPQADPTMAPVATWTATAEPSATPAPPPTATPATRTLKVAINAAFKPFVFIDENGKLAGFDIDLLNALDEVADVEVAYVNTSIEDMLAGVASGAYDAAISAITVTPARQERMDFTVPYFRAGQAPVSFFSAGQGLATAMGSTTITSTASLDASHRVGVKQGTTGAEFVASQTAVQVVEYAEAQQALDGLTAGEVDAVVLDISILADYTINNPGAIMLVGGPVTDEEYAIAVNKQRPEVLAMLNDALADVRANGTYDGLLRKWFGTP